MTPARRRAAAPATQAEGGLLIVLALVALALNLRGPITAIPPVTPELRQEFGVGPVTIGLLTTIPVLCFGLLTLAASAFIARMTIEVSIFVTLIGAGLGTCLRAFGGIELALLGTLVLGIAATLGNIVSLLVIARDFPRSSHFVTGLYAASLNVGTMITSASTAPLAALFGWRFAVACWSGLALVAIALWALAFARDKATAPLQQIPDAIVPEASLVAEPIAGPHPAGGPAWKRASVWLLAIGFGAHVFLYYGLTAWLPTFLRQTQGMSADAAGYAASLFQIAALLGSFGIPVLSSRMPRALLMVLVGCAWLVTPLGLYLAPSLWPVWAIAGGAATGGGFTATFILVVAYAADLDDNRRISAIVQGLGYSLASLGPLVVGALHAQSKDWDSSLIALGLAACIVIAASLTNFLEERRTDPA